MPPRNIIGVIDEILEILPADLSYRCIDDNFSGLRLNLRKIRTTAMYQAPEVTLDLWMRLSQTLAEELGDPTNPRYSEDERGMLERISILMLGSAETISRSAWDSARNPYA
jgi:hypothetical protein